MLNLSVCVMLYIHTFPVLYSMYVYPPYTNTNSSSVYSLLYNHHMRALRKCKRYLSGVTQCNVNSYVLAYYVNSKT